MTDAGCPYCYTCLAIRQGDFGWVDLKQRAGTEYGASAPTDATDCQVLSMLSATQSTAARVLSQPASRKNNFQGEIIYAPPPFGQKAILRGRGGGVYILNPPWQDFYTPPSFIRPPTPRRIFSGVGGWGCIKFGPPNKPYTTPLQ